MLYKFIPKGILSRVVIIENDISEQKRYSISFKENDNKNDLYHAIDFVRKNDLRIFSGYIYIDVNKSR